LPDLRPEDQNLAALNNQQAMDEEVQLGTHLTLINKISGQVAAKLDLDILLQRAVYLIRKTFDCHHVAIFLVEGKVLSLKAIAGAYSAYISPDFTQPLSEDIVGWVVTHGEKMIVQDVEVEPRYVPVTDKHPFTRSELCVPIKVADHILGGIDLQSMQLNAFNQYDVMVLETVANQIAIAIEKIYLPGVPQEEMAAQRHSEEMYQHNIQQLRIAYEQAKIYAGELNQKIAEYRSLAEIWRRYEFIVNASKEFMTLIGRDCTYEAVNEAYCQALDRPRSDIVGKKVTDVWGEERFQAHIKSYLDECFAGREIHYQKWFEFATQGLRYFDVAFYPYYDQEGAVTHAAVAFRDMTEQEQAREALQRSEERFRQVVVSISDHIYVSEVASDGRRKNIYLSPHIEALTGYPLEKFETDWNFWPSAVIHPDDKAAAARQAAQLARGQNSELEYRLRRADGKTIWVRDSARVQTDGRSNIIYGLVSDITERKLVEEKIRKLNENLEQRVVDRTRELSALYEITAIGSEALSQDAMLARSLERILVAIGSREGHIHLLDQTGHSLRLAAQQGVPADLSSQIDMLPLDFGLEGWVVEHGEPLLVSNLATDGQIYHSVCRSDPCAYAGAPMRVGGQIVGVLCVIREVEQQFSVEEVALLASIADQVGVVVENARLRRQAELAAVMEERERLARELHDSVTQSLYSLTLLAGGGKRLAKAGTLANLADYFTDLGEIAQQALKEMRLLVYELRPSILEQGGLVGALQQRLDSVEGRAGVEARLLVEDTVQLPALVEEGLYRIAQEALNNALKHAMATSVTVRVYRDDGQLVMVVKDDGVGFEPDALSDTGGIGLISIRERVEKIGGKLDILTAPGQGTTIQVSVATHDP